MNERTRLIHGRHTTDDYTGAAITPIYQTSTYLQDDIGNLHQGYKYPRIANPTRSSVESVVATLENDKHGSAFNSGIATISAVVVLLNKGDRIILGPDVYGGTYRVLTKVSIRFDIEVDFIDTTHTDSIVRAVRPTAKMLFIKTPSNPLLRVTDIKKSAEITGEHGLISVVGNTFMTPYYQNPLDLGIDIVLHSTTKCLGEYSDAVAGSVTTSNDNFAERLALISNSTSGILGPQDSYLLVRSARTLGLRMEQTNRSVIEIIKMLQAHPAVQQVFYPSIESRLSHDVRMAQADGHTGVIAFKIKNTEGAEQLIKATSYCTLAESLSAVEGSTSVPVLITHTSIPADIRAKEDITDRLVRASVGIEDTKGLIDDLKQALDIL